MIKIGLAQINFWVGDFEKNIKKIITFINKAKQNKLDLLIFPELSVVGYPPLDLLLNTQFINKNLQFLNLIIKETKNLSCLVGFVNKKDKDIYNACAFISNRKLVSVYHKVKLEENIFFNEKRYFKEGSSPYIYEFKNYKFSISLGKELKHLYSYFKKNKVDFIVNPSCFPFYLGEFDSRKNFLSSLAKKINSSILNCNLVGAQDELVFGGKSMLVSSLGELILYGKGFEEELLIFKFKLNKKYRAKKFLTDNMKDIFSAISLGIYDYVRKSGFKKVILGVSGGLDSALVLTITTITLGKKNVKALIMPSRYTSMETFSDAKKICKKLGIEYFIIDIEEIFQTYLKILK
ncbi:MAG: NAD(+) synthase, partial [Candidatus Aenigmatarchaeota archaeon]